MDLDIDGYIAQVFSPERAERYFLRLLGDDVQSFRPVVSHERPQAFYLTSSPMQNSRASLSITGRPLDYAISQAGTVIPQRMFSSRNPADAQRRANVSLNLPIFFIQNDCMTLGLALARSGIVGVDRPKLLGEGDVAPVGNGSTLYLRINWPGYSDWSSQIRTRDHTTAHNTITLAQFTGRVASAVDRFLDEAQRLQGEDPNWCVGAGGITKEQVILIGVVHVSQGSWQPILQLNRYVVPRRQYIPGLP